MKALTQQQKIALAGAGVVAAALCYFLMLLLPAQRSAAASSRELSQVTAKLAESERMYRETLTAKTDLVKLRKQIAGAYLKGPDVQAAAITEAERLTKELNITLTSIRPSEVESKDGSVKHPIVIKVESDLGRIVQLLYDLEKPERRLWVEGVEITSAKQTGEVLTATLYLAVYAPAPQGEDFNAKT